MNARTALSLVAAVLLAACSAPSEQASTFEDSTTPPPPQAFSAPTTSESPSGSPTEAPAQPASETTLTYEINVDAAAETLPASCAAGFTAYNDCDGSPIELSWKDLGDRAPKSAKVELGVSIFCGDPNKDLSKPQSQAVSINGGAIGSFDADLAACSCNAPATAYSFDVTTAVLEAYKAGGKNSIRIEGANRCIGVGGLDDSHTVARIVVTY